MESTEGVDERRLTQRLTLLLFVGIAAVYSVSPVITNYDSYSYFPTAVSLVNRRTLSLDGFRHVPVVATNYTVTTHSHHLITAYPWAVSLFAIPAVILIDLIHALGGPSADSVVAHHPQIGSLVQLWTASIVTASACALLGLLVYRRLDGPGRSRRAWAIGAALVFAFATSAWSTASRSLWQHGPAILFLSAGLLGLDRIFPPATRPTVGARLIKKVAFGSGLAFAGAVAMRPTNAVAFGLAGILLAWRARAALSAYAGGALCIFGPWTLITHHYYGGLVQPYDQADKLGFTSTFFESIAANLVSPSRGLLVFSPIVATAFAGAIIALKRRRFQGLEMLSAMVIVLYLIAIALYPVWWAGNSFGPRFMSETLPFLLLLAIPFLDWLRMSRMAPPELRVSSYRAACVATSALIAFSVVVNAQGGLLRASTCWNGMPVNIDSKPSRAWSWADPQFDSGLRALSSIGIHAVMHCPR